MMKKAVLSEQPAYLSKEQFYKACHIGKATAFRTFPKAVSWISLQVRNSTLSRESLKNILTY